MKLHIVGGFLGSGKTTAIVSAAKLLMARPSSHGRSLRVGVVTNDKGRHLVDTAFFRGAQIPTVEVPGGCFRCNYGDFQDRIAQLQTDAQPDVIFAESVGSCVDLVGPVVKPLLEASDLALEAITYSVFADIRLLSRRLKGQDLPFTEEILYIFDQQLEESQIIVVNKIDLQDGAAVAEVMSLAQQRFPGRVMLGQNSLLPEGPARWLTLLESPKPLLRDGPLDVDYRRYMKGAAQMSWLDEAVTFTVPEGQGRAAVLAFIATVVQELRGENRPLGHLKFFIQADSTRAKISFTSLEQEGWESEVPALPGTEIMVVTNARVQMPATRLRAIVTDAHGNAGPGRQPVMSQTSGIRAFHPRVRKSSGDPDHK
ncbi:MAG: hypothetical protein JXB35_13090 [Anaerolineae bacterium]|nr:hypothetical protein [Anaerolineae bacterium]